jgi:hypothetical protein
MPNLPWSHELAPALLVQPSHYFVVVVAECAIEACLLDDDFVANRLIFDDLKALEEEIDWLGPWLT